MTTITKDNDTNHTTRKACLCGTTHSTVTHRNRHLSLCQTRHEADPERLNVIHDAVRFPVHLCCFDHVIAAAGPVRLSDLLDGRRHQFLKTLGFLLCTTCDDVISLLLHHMTCTGSTASRCARFIAELHLNRNGQLDLSWMSKTSGKIHNREHLHYMGRDKTLSTRSYSATKGHRNFPLADLVSKG